MLADRRDDQTLTRHRWLMNQQNMSLDQWCGFKVAPEGTLETDCAWTINKFAMTLWNYTSRSRATGAWKRWLA